MRPERRYREYPNQPHQARLGRVRKGDRWDGTSPDEPPVQMDLFEP